MQLNNKVYDVMKWLAQYLLPAVGTLYFALASIWGLPFGEEIIGTISAVDLFLAAILGISSMDYKGDGTLHIDTTTDADVDKYTLSIDTPLDDLENMSEIVLKVDPE